MNEGEKGYYTIKSLIWTIISKELTPPKNEVIGMALGDVAMPDTYGTLFMYLNKYNEDQLFDFANKYNIHLLHFSKDELVKIKNTIDMDLVTKYFLEYLNADRVAQGLEPVTSTAYGREIATIRAQEQADYGHYYTDGERDVRPDGSSWKTVDNKGVALFEYVTSAPEEFHRIISEKYLAMDFYYNNWKNYTSYSFTPNYSKVSLGLGVAKGSLINGNSIQFGRDEGRATAVVAFIAE